MSDLGDSQSDHLMVYMKSVKSINNQSSREKGKVKIRRMPQSALNMVMKCLKSHDWSNLFEAKTAHQKAEIFYYDILFILNKHMPEKLYTFSSDDSEFFTPELKVLDRKRKRIYYNQGKSPRWKNLNKIFKSKLAKAKINHYNKMIKQLKTDNPARWYSSLKRMTSHDQQNNQDIFIDETSNLSGEEQAEILADKFSSIINEYEPLKSDQIFIPFTKNPSVTVFKPSFILSYLKGIKINRSTVSGDIPAKIIKVFASYLCIPFTHILNSMIKRGEYPNIWKYEIQTPIPKVHPPSNINHLRNISGLLNFDKLAQKILGEMIVDDMKYHLDPSQYGNTKGISIQHYLVRMINKILSTLDDSKNGESLAIIASLIDWKDAFPRQCPKLGINSFMRNGVRNEFIPLLINFFQERKMSVKWHGKLSSIRELNGSGPQGSSIGLLEYISQSNNNADFVDQEERYKFMDDLSILETVNLISVGLTSYNIRGHIPSDIPTHNGYIPEINFKTKSYMEQIKQWTDNNKVKLNLAKTKLMIVNYTHKNLAQE